MSLVWNQRSRLYLVGVAGLVVATLAYVVGHVAPYWVTQDASQNQPTLNIGLWFSCEHGGSCVSHAFAFDADSIKAVRILQVLGLVMMVLSVVISLFANCRRQHPGTSFFLELVIVLGVALGFCGSMVYLGETRENVENSSSTYYDWAFALNVAATVLALLSAALIFMANVRDYRRGSRGRGASGSDQAMFVKGRGSPSQSVSERPVPEPPTDYHHDNTVYFMQNPVSHQPVTNLHFLPNQGQGGSLADGIQDARWRMIRMKMPPPRGAYDDRGLVSTEQADPRGRPVGDPGTPGPQGPFTLPRVIVRGFYVPGYGYPEYAML